jgi:hypothetical protein
MITENSYPIFVTKHETYDVHIDPKYKPQKMLVRTQIVKDKSGKKKVIKHTRTI